MLKWESALRQNLLQKAKASYFDKNVNPQKLTITTLHTSNRTPKYISTNKHNKGKTGNSVITEPNQSHRLNRGPRESLGL